MGRATDANILTQGLLANAQLFILIRNTYIFQSFTLLSFCIGLYSRRPSNNLLTWLAFESLECSKQAVWLQQPSAFSGSFRQPDLNNRLFGKEKHTHTRALIGLQKGRWELFCIVHQTAFWDILLRKRGFRLSNLYYFEWLIMEHHVGEQWHLKTSL